MSRNENTKMTDFAIPIQKINKLINSQVSRIEFT
jgi:hypothetical protein